MKAISLWQPWASLWLTDAKIHETRHWPTKYRGFLYVHAAKHPIRESDISPELREICEDLWGGHFWTELPFGAVIGVVNLVDCVKTEMSTVLSERDSHCGDFSPGRFAWRRELLTTSIGPWPYKGRQGLFNIDDLDVVANKILGGT